MTEDDKALYDAMERLLARLAEDAEAVATAPSEFAAYWAGSAAASVERDYKAGRVKTVKRDKT